MIKSPQKKNEYKEMKYKLEVTFYWVKNGRNIPMKSIEILIKSGCVSRFFLSAIYKKVQNGGLLLKYAIPVLVRFPQPP